MRPYRDTQVTDKCIIREFNEKTNPSELLWHVDNESRTIIPLQENNWKIQIDNKLPVPITGYIHIKKHEWHRLIKGNNNLLLKIYKHTDN
jgi:hypothetical protein